MVDTIVAEGPYLGPTEYLTGVQEITAALVSVDAAVASVDATLVGGFAAVTAAVAASATAITTTVGVEASQTRDLLNVLVDRLLVSQRLVRMPVGVPRTVFRFSTTNTIAVTRVVAPSNDDTVYYGLTFQATVGTGTVLRFDPYMPDATTRAGPRYGELVYMTLGSNPAALVVFRQDY